MSVDRSNGGVGHGDDMRWMARALELADRAEKLDEVPVGAVVVKDGVIIGEGWNNPISGCDPTGHAEMMALRAAAKAINNYRLVDCQLYVTIEPCTMCAGAIVHARIGRVIFGALEPKAGAVVSNKRIFDGDELNHRVEYCGELMAIDCSDKISAFFKRRRDEKKAERAKQKAQETKKPD